MLNLVYSNKLEALIAHLAQKINEDYLDKMHWNAIQIVVPNSTMREYVRIGLAKKIGIIANLHFQYIDEMIQQLVTLENYEVISITMMQNTLLNLLSNSKYLNKSCPNVLKKYLKYNPSDLKLTQLVSTLSKLYHSYDIHYPNLIKSWRKQKNYIKPFSVTETWQKKIWLDATNLLDIVGLHHLTISEITQLPLLKTNINNIHIFNMPVLDNVYYEFIEKLKSLYDVNIYALNPCQEFWEDLVTENEITAQAINTTKFQYNFIKESYKDKIIDLKLANSLILQEPYALKLWGLAGRNNIKLLNKIANYDFIDKFQTPKVNTLLKQIQNDIITFQIANKKFNKSDSSITLLACPSYRREVEIIATEIWKLIDEYSNTNKPLSFSDIAIIIPPNQEDSYIPSIEVSFKDIQNIPWVHKERLAKTLKEVLDIVKLLLELPLTDFPRTIVLNIATHPNITKRFGAINIKMWLQLCNDLGIIRGIDNKAITNLYTEDDVLNWDQGLKRITLGVFIANTDLQYEKYSYTPLSVSDRNAAGYFIAFIRSLIDDTNNLRYGYNDIDSWVNKIILYINNWLDVENDEIAAIVDKISNFLRKTFIYKNKNNLKAQNINFHTAKILIIESIITLYNQQPNSLYGGVVVANYTQIRSIPFRACFLLGLEIDKFPRRDEYSNFDLCDQINQTNNASTKTTDKFNFLETVMSTRDRLYLSYTYIDDVTGEQLEPSSVYKNMHDLANQYLINNLEIKYHPFYRFDQKYFCKQVNNDKFNKLDNYSYTAYNECKSLMTRELKNAIEIVNEQRANDTINTVLNNKKNNFDQIPSDVINNILTIRISDVKKWLECPLTGSAAVHLGLRKVNKNISTEEELFVTNKLDKYLLLRDVTLKTLHTGNLEEAYNQTIKKLKNQGRSSFGLFADIEKINHIEIINSWLKIFNNKKPLIWSLGYKNIEKSIYSKQISQLEIKINSQCKINLIGDLQPQIENEFIFFEIGKPPKVTSENIRKKILRSYVDQIIRTCILNKPQKHNVLFAYSEGNGQPAISKRLELDPIDIDDSWLLLSNWVSDIVTGNNNVLMPIEAILDMYNQNNYSKCGIINYINKQIIQNDHKFSSLYGPVPIPQKYSPPIDLTNIIETRFGTFLNQIQKIDSWQ